MRTGGCSLLIMLGDGLMCKVSGDITLSVSEVSNIIQNLDKSKATGPDQVHNRLLIVASSIIAEPLTILFNRSLRESKLESFSRYPLAQKGAQGVL